MGKLVETRVADGVSVVLLNVSRIEARIADELAAEMIEAFEPARAAIFDFSKVGFIDSVGMKALMTVLLHCRKTEGACVLHGVSEDIMSVFVITRLNRLLPLTQDEDEAMATVRKIVEENKRRTMDANI